MFLPLFTYKLVYMSVGKKTAFSLARNVKINYVLTNISLWYASLRATCVSKALKRPLLGHTGCRIHNKVLIHLERGLSLIMAQYGNILFEKWQIFQRAKSIRFISKYSIKCYKIQRCLIWQHFVSKFDGCDNVLKNDL